MSIYSDNQQSEIGEGYVKEGSWISPEGHKSNIARGICYHSGDILHRPLFFGLPRIKKRYVGRLLRFFDNSDILIQVIKKGWIKIRYYKTHVFISSIFKPDEVIEKLKDCGELQRICDFIIRLPKNNPLEIGTVIIDDEGFYNSGLLFSTATKSYNSYDLIEPLTGG